MRLAVCVAEADPAGDGRDHLQLAARYAREAAQAGAELLVLPETFPGRWRSPIDWAPLADLLRLAAEHRLVIAGGYPEPTASGAGCYNTVSVCGPDGVEVGRYRRVSPVHAPWTYQGGKLWDFEWVRGAELPVMAISSTTVGVLICSEVYVPELARVLVMKGAEILLYPTGVLRPESELFDTWTVVARARAIENLSIVALCSSSTPLTGPGYALVASPEGVLLESSDSGVHVVDVDLDRVRWLRSQRDRIVEGPRPWSTKPGVIRDWRAADVLRAHSQYLLGD